MKLPEEFANKMKRMLGDREYEEFLASYQQQRYYGLRVNTLKIRIEDFVRMAPFKLKPVPWTKDGFYYSAGDSPGRHPYYHAGLYYIQEPSAMLPGKVLGARPGEKVLDLCAAPGGKTVQIAAGMQGKGLLVSNDVSADRVKALVKNIELCGVRNAVVTNATSSLLAQKFPGYFDRILVDAPCSGEGMFRKDEDAVKSWGRFKCEACAGMQRDILNDADKMLAPGGFLVYSTCTFSPEEDEIRISEFLSEHQGYRLLELPKTAGIQDGKPEWADGNPELTKTARLWPHKLSGEGHFVALLQKAGELKDHNGPEQPVLSAGPGSLAKGIKRKDSNSTGYCPETVMEAYRKFEEEHLNIRIDGYFIHQGSNLYCLPEAFPDLHGIRVAKFGWYLGEYNGKRFEPSHSLCVSLRKEEIKNTLDFPAGTQEVLSYLKGETLMLEGEKGLTAVCVDGYTLGWAMQTGDMLKNLYPKGWRKMS